MVAVTGCRTPTQPTQGSFTISGSGIGPRATFTCNPGYTLSGSATITCQNTGQWSPSEPTCTGKPKGKFYTREHW